MIHSVKVHHQGKVYAYQVERGKNLLEFLRENLYDVTTPCGGKGTCGKCRIKVEGYVKEASEKEKKLLKAAGKTNGYRLACYNVVEDDIEIFLEDFNREASIVTEGVENKTELSPLIVKKNIKVKSPDLSYQKSDQERVIEAYTSASEIALSSCRLDSLELLRSIPELIRTEDSVTVIEHEGQITGVEKGNTENRIYGIAIDIGTTTIAAYLYDLKTGNRISVHSTLNPQRKYGADVLSRIEYTNNSEENQNEMHDLIIDCINKIIGTFERNNGISSEDIYLMVFAGNTTMMHFLMNLQAKYIAVSPFIPVTTKMQKIKPAELNININRSGLVIVFPCVSAYIGADTVAAILSSNMNNSDETCLLIDIGTNGEIVLGNKDWMYSCSTAAGPAFEGANIQYGVGGIKGAIDKINFAEKLEYHTIGSEKAIGICGSGIVDAIAGMLDKGIIDETGRIVDKSEYEQENHTLINDYMDRLVQLDGMNAFIIARKEDTAINNDILITQKDVRELQNAKAAIAAGIKILIKQAGINPSDIKKVYLAGGFGNYININSAFKIGLLPSELAFEKVVSIGNAAGAGAIQGLLSKHNLSEAELIKNKVKYIELSALADFVDEYVNCMFFE